MRALYPEDDPAVDPLALYLAAPRPMPPDRPWVMVNMIASVDGATAVDGLSGGLGGPADKAVFRAVRACADWIVVGSGTAAAERYRTPTTPPEVADVRRATGRDEPPRLAVVTASGHLDPTIPALADPAADAQPALVVTGRDADRDALAATGAEIEVVDGTTPTPGLVLGALFARGARVVLAEGGPTLNGRLADAGLIDELCLSLSPTLVGGDSARIVQGASDAEPVPLRLDHLLEENGLLFARYVRA